MFCHDERYLFILWNYFVNLLLLMIIIFYDSLFVLSVW